MLASTTRLVKGLSLSEKERAHHSRNRSGWHVFVSRYFLDFKDAPTDIKRSLISSFDPLHQHRVEPRIYDDSDDSACNHNVVIKNGPSIKRGDTMKLACAHWRSMSDAMKESWRKRAEYLNSRPIPGKYLAIPYRLKSNFVSTVLESLTGDWKRTTKKGGTGTCERYSEMVWERTRDGQK